MFPGVQTPKNVQFYGSPLVSAFSLCKNSNNHNTSRLYYTLKYYDVLTIAQVLLPGGNPSKRAWTMCLKTPVHTPDSRIRCVYMHVCDSTWAVQHSYACTCSQIQPEVPCMDMYYAIHCRIVCLYSKAKCPYRKRKLKTLNKRICNH